MKKNKLNVSTEEGAMTDRGDGRRRKRGYASDRSITSHARVEAGQAFEIAGTMHSLYTSFEYPLLSKICEIKLHINSNISSGMST